MAKTETRFICQNCGKVYGSWQGKCIECESWNTIVEEVVNKEKGTEDKEGIDSAPTPLSKVELVDKFKKSSGSSELDRALGGGIVNGEIVLLGGPPGIGKSTLLLQTALYWAKKDKKILYIAGEESPQQIKVRIQRLKNAASESFFILPETNVGHIIAEAEKLAPDLIVVDSIQTLKHESVSSSPGSVSQIKNSTMEIKDFVKENNIPTFLVGHITKKGSIAGPKVLEHVVDCVLYFQGDMQQEHRIIRAIKNRFGSTNEIGIFKMTSTGLEEVNNPSELFIAEHDKSVSGTAIVAGMEGTRPILVEIQALVSAATYSSPQRVVRGLDKKRVSILCALLEKRVGLPIKSQDVFLNIVGGVKLQEPAVDLGIALSIVSSFRNEPIKNSRVIIGEVGLGGEVRPVSHARKRVKEAQRLGFENIILPENSIIKEGGDFSIKQLGAKSVSDAFEHSLESNSQKKD